MLWLSKEDTIKAGVLDMKRAQKLVEKTFCLYEKEQALNAQEIPVIHPDFGDGRFYSLPAYVGGEIHTAGLKWTTLFPENEKQGSPASCTLLVLSNPENGMPEAILDGTLISSMRTGAVSAVAFANLCKKEVKQAVCCGAGVQARQQLRALCTVKPELEQVYIWGRTEEKARRLGAELSAEFPQIHISSVKDFQEVVRECDVVIAATPAAVPYLKKEHFKENCFYLQIGMNEIEEEALNAFDAIISDDFDKGIANSRQSVYEAYRKGALNLKLLQGNLSEYLLGKRDAEQWKNGKIMFDAFGLPIFDLALGAGVYQRALELKMGTELIF